jgi:hypothetical protein
MTRLSRLALRANGTAVVQTPAALVRVRAPYLKKPAYGGFFALLESKKGRRMSQHSSAFLFQLLYRIRISAVKLQTRSLFGRGQISLNHFDHQIL